MIEKRVPLLVILTLIFSIGTFFINIFNLGRPTVNTTQFLPIRERAIEASASATEATPSVKLGESTKSATKSSRLVK